MQNLKPPYICASLQQLMRFEAHLAHKLGMQRLIRSSMEFRTNRLVRKRDFNKGHKNGEMGLTRLTGQRLMKIRTS